MGGWLNLRGAFPNSADEYTQPMKRLLQRRRAEVDEAWGKLGEGCAANNERMARFGLALRTDKEGVIKLNVGGSKVSVCWQLLAEAEGFRDSPLGALLEGVWGEGKIPRDADGRIVLDESPTCTSHIITQATRKAYGHLSSVGVAADELPCLVYTAHAMGLPRSVLARHPKYVSLSERSTILELFEIAPLGEKIREWVGSPTDQMTLIHRATRDGFDVSPFEARNKNSAARFTLVRVRSGKEHDADSIVGGFKVSCYAARTFIFMLKNGCATQANPSKPIKWTYRPKPTGGPFGAPSAVYSASIAKEDFDTALDTTSGFCKLKTGRDHFDIEENSPFLALNGNKVVEIEVYQYSTPHLPMTTAPSTSEPGGVALIDAKVNDTQLFGDSIASSLMEERLVLDRAVSEMEAAGARVSAAVSALEPVYGPSVAAGEQDAVVELNVRGTRMTTLRSTLQACPRSDLAAMFDEDRCPATDKDKDEHGRRLVDCDPTSFSKILDVLRMRKRASWRAGVTNRKQEGGREEKGKGEEKINIGDRGAVLIQRADVKAFDAAVNMYFRGCHKLIFDMVRFT